MRFCAAIADDVELAVTAVVMLMFDEVLIVNIIA